MFPSHEVMAVFGVSMILSFTISLLVLMVVAAKRGLLRVGARTKHATLSSGLLLPPNVVSAPKSVEMAPLATYTA